MTALIFQTPIALRNPFSLLEPEVPQAATTLPDPTSSAPSSSTSSVTADDEEDVDLSTWCVVNSSDDEMDEHVAKQDLNEGDEEIYLWHSTSGEGREGDLAAADPHHHIAPLKLSSSTDGFTYITRATIAHSTNSASATAPEHRGAWVVKVSKKRSKPQSQKAQGKGTEENKEALAVTKLLLTQISSSIPFNLNGGSSDNVATTTKNTNTTITCNSASNKRKDDDDHDHFKKEKEEDQEEAQLLYMSMTEHELSKSSKAAKIKNGRVATQHDHDLARALGCLSEETDKVDKKAIRSRCSATKTAKSSNITSKGGNKARVLDVHPSEF